MQYPYQTRSHRLSGYDYKSIGGYFVTICTADRRHLLGCCNQGEMRPSLLGKLLEKIWKEIPLHEHSATVDEFIVMPNHIHGILFINQATCRRKACLAPTVDNRSGSLSAIIGSFKSAVTKRARDSGLVSPREVIWQRNYYDHIIRNETSLKNIQNYIIDNPSKWEQDEYFSDHVV